MSTVPGFTPGDKVWPREGVMILQHAPQTVIATHTHPIAGDWLWLDDGQCGFRSCAACHWTTEEPGEAEVAARAERAQMRLAENAARPMFPTFPNPCPVCGATDEHAERMKDTLAVSAKYPVATICSHPREPGHGTGCCCAGLSRPMFTIADIKITADEDQEPGTMPHREIPVQVTAWVDEGIAALVTALNAVPGVMTLDSCQKRPDDRASVMFCTYDRAMLYDAVGRIAQAIGDGQRENVTLSLWWGGNDAPAVADLTCPPALVPHVAEQVRANAVREIARRMEAPDSTPEEYEQAIREQREREGRPVTRTTEPPPATVQRGSNCPIHGGPLLWLGDGELMCQEGHGYQIPVPPPQTGKTRAKR